jgi:histidine kinase/DNA gyrase B/HSP90-like ATPase
VSIRLRVALVFALALAMAFALGGWLFVSQLSAAMLRSTDAALSARLSQAGRYAEDEGNPRSPAVARGRPAPGEYIVQIVSPSGQVTHASPDAGNVPLLSAAQLQRARHGGLTLTRNLYGEPIRVSAAPLRFAPRGTEVDLCAEMAGQELVIEVCDRGPGFPPSFLPHVFERFTRPDLGRARDAGGAGLGLSIVQAIAHTHGGRAMAGNRDGGGAVVRLEIPCPPEPAQQLT